MPNDEIEVLLEEVSEIKHLSLFRLLLSHASLFPAAIRADSLEALLNDVDVKDADLRELCLKMEIPDPQEVRDACADLQSEDENKEVGSYLGEPQEADEDKNNARPFIRPDRRHDIRSWMPKPTKEAQKQDDSRKNNLENRSVLQKFLMSTSALSMTKRNILAKGSA